MTLQSELGMKKGFENPAHEAVLSIYYTASQLKKKAGDFFRIQGLTDVQYIVLTLLVNQSGENGGLTQVELSRMMLVNRANITTLIDRMEKANLVVRQPAPGDRRYNVIRLTPHGEKMYGRVHELYKDKVSDIMKVLPENEFKDLMRTLQKLRNHIDGVVVE